MGQTYFFTGYPGFIAHNLITNLFEKNFVIDKLYLLVLPNMIPTAQKQITELSTKHSIDERKFSLISGDITYEGLQIPPSDQEELANSVTHVFHLAAIYDLAVPKDIAYKVNVIGTKNVNQWLLTLKNINRYTYFSTAYVSGNRTGTIFETELNKGQSFKNHYEQTKFEAEVLVEEMKRKVPTTIIRPGIVKGNSKTGETIKFDGPYFVLNFFDRLRWLPIIPYLGKGDVEGNFVPVDYIFDATLFLSHNERGIGKTYHLTDPAPLKVREVYKIIMEEFLRKKPFGTIPLSLAKFGLSFSTVRKWLGVELEALDYFTCSSHYDTSQAVADLRGTGISCPTFRETIKPMVDFYRINKNNPKLHIEIK